VPTNLYHRNTARKPRPIFNKSRAFPQISMHGPLDARRQKSGMDLALF